jgi:acetaldehyde dehydrogenase (acetylating)
MTLGCGAAAGNSTSDNVGPLHLINIKRLAYVVRKAEEAFEMPLDYNAASYPAASAASSAAVAIDRGVVAAAVERYLASRGIAVPPPASGGPSAGSCACNTGAPSQPVARAVIPNVAADVVDRFLAQRSGGSPAGGYG